MIGKNNYFSFISIILILILSAGFAISHGLGLYGFGNDFHSSYYIQNYKFGHIFNKLGWIIATFSFNNFHLGVYFTTFILSASFGFLLKKNFEIKYLNSSIFFTLIFLIGLHTWPIIMSTSNAMRQGLCMSMVFLALTFYMDKKILLSFLFIFLSLFMHKSGPFFLFIFLCSIIFERFQNNFNFKGNFFLMVSSVIIFIFSYTMIILFETGEADSNIISKDYRYPLLLIGVIFLILFHFKKQYLSKNFMNIYVYFFIVATIPILYLKYNYEYERMQMMMLIPYIFSFAMILNKKSLYFYYLSVFIALLFLTIYNDMYDSFLPYELKKRDTILIEREHGKQYQEYYKLR